VFLQRGFFRFQEHGNPRAISRGYPLLCRYIHSLDKSRPAQQKRLRLCLTGALQYARLYGPEGPTTSPGVGGAPKAKTRRRKEKIRRAERRKTKMLKMKKNPLVL